MSYYIYHVPKQKIGVTRNPERRVEKMQGYLKHQYEILEIHDCIDIASTREIELQKEYGYTVDVKPYKDLFKTMKISCTEKTSTFPVEKKDIRKWLKQNIGEKWKTPQGYEFEITKENSKWIIKNIQASQYRSDSSYIYNEPFFKEVKVSELEIEIFSKIREWADQRGIYEKGDPKTQTLKLYEEIGELSQALLARDQEGIVDAIGDSVVVLTNLAHLAGCSIEYCIDSAWNEIKDRKGKMSHGTFIKEETL